MKNLVICDVRNTSSIYKLLATLQNKGFDNNDKILLIIKDGTNYNILKNYYENFKVIKYEGRVDDNPVIINLIKGKYKNFKSNLHDYFDKSLNYSNIIFITSFNKGCWYVYLVGLIKKKFKSFYLISFDDGYDTIRLVNYIYKFRISDFVKQNIMKIFSRHRVKNISKFDFINTNEHFTSFHKFNFSNIYSKVSYYNNKLIEIYKNTNLRNKIFQKYENKKFILLLSHHAVESNRMSLKDYQLIIIKSLKSSNISDDDVLLISKHHSETNLNHIFYENLHNNVLFIDFPAEAALYSNKINSCISPFNTTIIQLDSMNHDFDFELFIGYVIPKSPDLDERIEKTITIMKNKLINYKIITLGDN